MTPFPILKTSRLLLRQITATDQENIFKGLSHPKVIQYYGVSFDSYEATKEQMDWYANLEKEKTGIWWAVCLASDGTFLGAGGFNDWDQAAQRAEIGFWLLPDHWGKGYMTEAMTLLNSYAFSSLNIHRIEGYVSPNNTPCINGLAKLGYTLEGLLRDWDKKDGQFQSWSVFSKLSTDEE